MSDAMQAPKPAATVLLVRDGESLEVLMVRRGAGLAFGASAWVFPGGKQDAADSDPAWEGLVEGGFTGSELALRVCAARETFEESGLLLGRDAAGKFASVEVCERLGARRGEVEKDPAAFMDVVREAWVKLALDRLVYFAHWITPDFEPRRFDTHFFLAAAPPEQVAAHDGSEAVDHGWVSPAWLLDQRLKGEAKLMFPTRLNLEVLAKSANAAEAERAARAQKVVTVSPVVFERDGGKWLRIPAEAGYSLSEERMDRVMK
jgi:8-oxo-dGTP pyrophosphatase MutT (NUDIX family)